MAHPEKMPTYKGQFGQARSQGICVGYVPACPVNNPVPVPFAGPVRVSTIELKTIVDVPRPLPRVISTPRCKHDMVGARESIESAIVI